MNIGKRQIFTQNESRTTKIKADLSGETSAEKLTTASKNEKHEKMSIQQEIEPNSPRRKMSISTPQHPKLVGITEAYGTKPNTPL